MLRSLQRAYLWPKLYSLRASFATGTDSHVPASNSTVPNSNLIFDTVAGSNIADIISENGVFVDKTSSAYKILTAGKKSLRFRGPKRLGKSTIFSMIEDLCRDNAQAIFEKTFINSTDFFTTHWKKVSVRDSKDPTYPVECLNFDFKMLTTPGKLEDQLISLIKDEGKKLGVPVRTHIGIPGAMKSLLDGIQSKGKKAIVLIDEADSPFNSLDAKGKHENKNLLDDFFSYMKRNTNIRLMLLTSTMDRHSLLGDSANNTEDITTYHSASPDLGFTQDDVFALFPDAYLAECGITEENKAKFFADLKLYYNGYRLREDSEETVYSPYSILQCRKHKCQIATYWEDDPVTDEIKSFVPLFPQLISQKTRIHFDKEKVCLHNLTLVPEVHEVVRFLWRYGIFTIAKYQDGVYELKPSNQEMINVYRRMVELRVWQTSHKSALFIKVIEHAEKRQCPEMGDALLLLFKPGNINFEVESDIETVLRVGLNRAVTAVAGGTADRQVPLGFAEKAPGKAEIVFTLPNSTYIFEIKMGDKESFDSAMAQLKTRKYGEELASNLKRKIYAVAMHYTHIRGARLQIAQIKPTDDPKVFDYDLQYAR